MTQDVTTPVQIEAGRAERDGCGCPPWVVQCAHFDGHILWLADPVLKGRYEPLTEACTRVTGIAFRAQFRVLMSDKVVFCPHCGTRILRASRSVASFNDEATALEAFHAAELRLLRGEPS